MIIPKLVETISDAQIVRMIRNSVKEYMTNHSSHITAENQVLWFQRHIKTNNKLYLYIDHNYAPVGYGYLKYDDRVWATLGLFEEFFNQGFGTEIYKHLIEEGRDVWIEIFSNNSPSLIAALKNGFNIESMNDKIVLLRKDIRGE